MNKSQRTREGSPHLGVRELRMEISFPVTFFFCNFDLRVNPVMEQLCSVNSCNSDRNIVTFLVRGAWTGAPGAKEWWRHPREQRDKERNP